MQEDRLQAPAEPRRQTGLPVAPQRCSGPPFPFPSPPLGPSLTQPHILTHPKRLGPGLRLWGQDVALPAQTRCCLPSAARVFERGVLVPRGRQLPPQGFQGAAEGASPSCPPARAGQGARLRAATMPACSQGHGCGRETSPSWLLFSGMKSPGCKRPSSAVVTQCWPC